MDAICPGNQTVQATQVFPESCWQQRRVWSPGSGTLSQYLQLCLQIRHLFFWSWSLLPHALQPAFTLPFLFFSISFISWVSSQSLPAPSPSHDYQRLSPGFIPAVSVSQSSLPFTRLTKNHSFMNKFAKWASSTRNVSHMRILSYVFFKYLWLITANDFNLLYCVCPILQSQHGQWFKLT